MANGKNCYICLYYGACEDRANDPNIHDCCVPEDPLREKQKQFLGDIPNFILVTAHYVQTIKAKSKYWSSLKQST
jgi:hypothetical protein